MMISNRQGYVTQAQRHVSVFISHCEQDNEEAQYYESLFKAFGLSAFQYGHGLHFGNHITENLRKEITKCHFFVFIISDYSLKSEWVQRELGMAIAIQRSNEIRKPIIIPIFAKESSWRKANKRPTRFKTRNFDTGQKLDDFDLNVRCYDKHANPHSDSDDELLSRMRPIIHVTRVGDFFDESIFFETKVFSLYKKLFPPIERDDPEDIIRWTLHSDLGSERVFYLPEKITYKLDSRYFILTLFDQAIGLAFFTYDYSTNLMYGNYIAVHKCWRGGAIADAFLGEISRVLEGLFPGYDGIVFEVEKFERKRIEEIVLRAEADGDLAEEDRSEIRKFLRVTWYQKIGCCFFKDKAEDEPISFTSPCLDPKAFPDWESLEEDYWIMWLPKKGGNLIDPKGDFIRAIRCIYIEILGKSLAETYLDIGSEYWQYVNSIVNRALDEYRNPV